MSLKINSITLLVITGLILTVQPVFSADPFGPLSVTTVPATLLPGIRGAGLDITFNLPREGNADLYDVKVTVPDEYPFFFEVRTVTLGRMLGGSSGTASFYFDIENDAIPGIYELDLVIQYSNEFGSISTITRPVSIKIREVPEDPFGPFIIDTVPSPIYEKTPYAKINVEFALASVGLGQVFNTTVLLDTPAGIDLISGPSHLGTVSEESPASATFFLDVSNAPSGQYELPVYLSYQPTPWSFEHYAFRTLTLWIRPYPQDPFSLVSATTTPTALPAGIKGALVELRISYPLTTEQPLYETTATIKPAPFFSGLGVPYQAGTIEPGSTAVASFYVDVARNAPEGQHLLPLEIQFLPWLDGELTTIERMIPVQVMKTPDDPFGPLTILTDPLFARSGAEDIRFELAFGLPEGSITELEEVTVELDVSAPFSATDSEVKIGRIGAGDTVSAAFYLDVDENTLPSEYSLNVNLKYGSQFVTGLLSVDREVKVKVISVPEDPFGAFTTLVQPSSIFPGAKDVRLELAFGLPEGIIEELGDITVSLGATPYLSTSESRFMVGRMVAGGSATATFYLDVDRDAPAGEYSIPVIIEYSSSLGPGSVRREAKLKLESIPDDPFGPLRVLSSPSAITIGSKNIRLELVFDLPVGTPTELEEVKVTISPSPPLTADNPTQTIGRMVAGGSATATFYLDVGQDAMPGEHQLPVEILYKLVDGEEMSTERIAKIGVEPGPALLILNVENTDGLISGMVQGIDLVISNNGTGQARDIQISVVPVPGSPVKPAGGDVVISQLLPGQEERVNLQVSVDEGTKGNQILRLHLTYTNQGALHEADKYISMEVGARSRPQLIVTEIVTSPTSVEIGKGFETRLVIRNDGEAATKSGTITFVPTRPVATGGSGSEIYLGAVEPGETRTVTTSFETDQSAFPGLVVVPYFLRYNDEVSQEYTKNGSFALSLYGHPRLYIKNIQIDPQVLEKGDEGLMTVTLTNIGTDDALDVEIVALGGEKLVTGTLNSMGVVSRDTVEAVLFGIYADKSLKPRSYSILIKATYHDSFGTVYEENRSIDIEVLKEKSLIPTEYMIVGVIAAAIILVLYVFFKGVPGISD